VRTPAANSPGMGRSLFPVPRAVPIVLAASLLAAALLALAASSAAALEYSYAPIGEFASGPGSGTGELNHPRRAAVDGSTGDIYVVDRDNNRVQVFKPSGNSAIYLTQFGGGVLVSPVGIAIDQSDGAVYVADAGNSRIVRYESDHNPTPSFSLDGSFTSPSSGTSAGQIGDFAASIAVDPTTGDILVADPGNNRVDRYHSDGSFVSAIDGSSSPEGAFTSLQDLAVEADGNVLVVDSVGEPFVPGTEDTGDATRVERFDPSGTFLASISPLGKTYTGLVASDPHNGNVITARIEPHSALKFIRPNANALGYVMPTFGTLGGLAVDPGASGRLYVVSDISGFGPAAGQTYVEVLSPVALPEVTIDPVSNVSSGEVDLSGTVNPEGVAAQWKFEYSIDGSHWSGAEAIPSSGAGNASVLVTGHLTGLNPSEHYFVRLHATNIAGGVTSDVESFTTTPVPPVVGATFVSPRTTTTARFNARIEPRNDPTSFYFEYGESESYGLTMPVSKDGDAGSQLNGSAIVSEEVSDLQPATTYHYRVVAENAGGAIPGPDHTFTTRTLAEMTIGQRGYELVNNPFKGNAGISNGSFAVSDLQRWTSPDGEKALWAVSGGAPGATTGSGNFFLATRSADGWHSRSVLPPAAEQYGGGTMDFSLIASAPDLSRFLFVNKRSLLDSLPYAFIRVGDNQQQEVLQEFSTPPNKEVAEQGIDASSDLSNIIFKNPFDGQIYDDGAGEPVLVGLMPNGLKPLCGVADYFKAGSTYHYVATSASRVYFGTQGSICSSTPQLYLRNRETNTTIRVSEPPVTGVEGPATFVKATPDGRSAIFTTTARLAANDTNTDADIYRFTEDEGDECLTCVVSDAAVLQSEILASGDLSRVYFKSRQVLIPGNGVAGEGNIYVWHDGQVDYVATFSGIPSLTQQWTKLTAGGDVLVFDGEGDGITTDQIEPGCDHCIQVYRYDLRDGSVTCVSCVPGGVTRNSAGGGTSLSDFEVSAEGDTIAFTTSAPLLRSDVNRTRDVYEWHNDALRLITDGVTEFPHGISQPTVTGISASGSDIFFTVAARITGFEQDGLSNLYDARIGGGFTAPTPPSSCVEDSCQGPLQAPPSLQDPGSSTFSGPANPTARKKAHKRKRHHRRKAKGSHRRHQRGARR
jgi:hypothetical protein